MTTPQDDDHTIEQRRYLNLSKITLIIANGVLDYTDIKVTSGAYLHLTEEGSTTKNVPGVYNLSYLQVRNNGSIIFNYNCLLIDKRYCKKYNSILSGIKLHVLAVLKISLGGTIQSDYQGYPDMQLVSSNSGSSSAGNFSGFGWGGFGIGGGAGGMFVYMYVLYVCM